MEFSIIIPFFNTGETIKKSLLSAINQTFTDYEIVLVDDGSTDNTTQIVKKILYLYNKKNVSVIRQDNQGAGKAKNTGIKNSHGDYLLFLDSDDFLDEDSLLKLHLYLEKYDEKPDVISFNVVIEKGIFKHKINLNNGIVGMTNSNINRKILTFSSTGCTKLIRKKYLLDNEIFYEERVIFDDIGYTLKALGLTDNILFVDEYIYHYVERNSSITHSALSCNEVIKTSNGILNDPVIKKMMPTFEDEINFTIINIILFVVVSNINLTNFNSNKQIKLVNYVKERFQNFSSNIYFKGKERQIELLLNGMFKKYFFRYNLEKYLKNKIVGILNCALGRNNK